MFTLSDIFIGNFGLTQPFGGNPQDYAKFGLAGHNGLDFGCPTGTQIIATANGKVIEVGDDANGYGHYVKVLHEGFFSLYAHLERSVISVGDFVVSGQLLGYADNTGNSTGAHLHFAVAPCLPDGTKTDKNNGYSGYIDPLNKTLCIWDVKNPSQPTVAHDQHADDLTKMLNWDAVVDFYNRNFQPTLDALDKLGGATVSATLDSLLKKLRVSSSSTPIITPPSTLPATEGAAEQPIPPPSYTKPDSTMAKLSAFILNPDIDSLKTAGWRLTRVSLAAALAQTIGLNVDWMQPDQAIRTLTVAFSAGFMTALVKLVRDEFGNENRSKGLINKIPL